MACLANGVPTITPRGRFTDAGLLDAAVFTPSGEPRLLGETAVSTYEAKLPKGPGVAQALSTAREGYLARFAVEHTVARLLADEGGG